MKCKNKFHIEHSENCHQSQPSNFFKVWTFFRCFDRDLWKMRQNNKFDTAQLFNYILNTQKMCHQSQPSSLIKVWTFFDVLADILERWSKITNLTLTNCFITYWTFKKCVIKTNQVISSKYGLFWCFGRYPWEMKQNYKFDTTQLFITYWTLKKCVIKLI